jgi:hypothetical protein
MNGVHDSHDAATQRRQLIGTMGVAVAIGLILGVHPLGSTELYDDGVRFVDHVGAFWVVIHFVGAILFLAIPTVIGAWSETLATPAGRAFARVATTAT